MLAIFVRTWTQTVFWWRDGPHPRSVCGRAARDQETWIGNREGVLVPAGKLLDSALGISAESSAADLCDQCGETF